MGKKKKELSRDEKNGVKKTFEESMEAVELYR